MINIESQIIADLMSFVRVKSDKALIEITDMVNACLMDMQMRGIAIDDINPQVKQCLKLYCKGHYGYDDNSERFITAYESLRDSMALSSDYVGGENNG